MSWKVTVKLLRPSLSLNPDCALGGLEIVENLFHGLLKADKGQHALLSWDLVRVQFPCVWHNLLPLSSRTIHTDIYIHVYIYIFMYIYMCIYTHSICIHVYIHKYLHTHIYINIHLYVCVCICIYVKRKMCVCVCEFSPLVFVTIFSCYPPQL